MIFSLAYLSQLYGENCMHAQSNIYDFSIVGLQPLHYLHDFLHDITQIILHKEPYTVTQFFFSSTDFIFTTATMRTISM